MSSPRVGCETTMSRGRSLSSRPRATFCRLPPGRFPAMARGFGGRASEALAARAGAPRVVARDVRAADADGAARRPAGAEDALRELALAVATHAGDAEDLAAVHLEVDAVQRGRSAVAERGEGADLEDDVRPGR